LPFGNLHVGGLERQLDFPLGDNRTQTGRNRYPKVEGGTSAIEVFNTRKTLHSLSLVPLCCTSDGFLQMGCVESLRTLGFRVEMAPPMEFTAENLSANIKLLKFKRIITFSEVNRSDFC